MTESGIPQHRSGRERRGAGIGVPRAAPGSEAGMAAPSVTSSVAAGAPAGVASGQVGTERVNVGVGQTNASDAGAVVSLNTKLRPEFTGRRRNERAPSPPRPRGARRRRSTRRTGDAGCRRTQCGRGAPRSNAPPDRHWRSSRHARPRGAIEGAARLIRNNPIRPRRLEFRRGGSRLAQHGANRVRRADRLASLSIGFTPVRPRSCRRPRRPRCSRRSRSKQRRAGKRRVRSDTCGQRPRAGNFHGPRTGAGDDRHAERARRRAIRSRRDEGRRRRPRGAGHRAPPAHPPAPASLVQRRFPRCRCPYKAPRRLSLGLPVVEERPRRRRRSRSAPQRSAPRSSTRWRERRDRARRRARPRLVRTPPGIRRPLDGPALRRPLPRVRRSRPSSIPTPP